MMGSLDTAPISSRHHPSPFPKDACVSGVLITMAAAISLPENERHSQEPTWGQNTQEWLVFLAAPKGVIRASDGKKGYVPVSVHGCVAVADQVPQCDSKRPSCTQCQKAGLQCGGYERPRIFVNNTKQKLENGEGCKVYGVSRTASVKSKPTEEQHVDEVCAAQTGVLKLPSSSPQNLEHTVPSPSPSPRPQYAQDEGDDLPLQKWQSLSCEQRLDTESPSQRPTHGWQLTDLPRRPRG